MLNDNLFKCDCCGMCCRQLNKIPQLVEFDNGNGECIHLKNNRCSIYSTRPLFCNVNSMYKEYFENIMTLESFYALNEQCCLEIKSLYALK